MTHAEFDLSELLDALRAGEMTDPIRTSLECVLQQLIEAEATAVIGAAPHERSDVRMNQTPTLGQVGRLPAVQTE